MLRPDKRRALPGTGKRRMRNVAERLKVSVRAKVAHPLQVIKRPFGHVKLRY